VLQAYLSALTSSLQMLEEQLLRLNSSSVGMSSPISTAYGDQADSRQDSNLLDVTKLFQVSTAA